MIVAFGTSSPWSGVALLEESGELLCAKREHAPGKASGTCLRLLTECLEGSGRKLEDATLFAADLGPGSFTGTRVGIMLAKTLAWSRGVPCAGASAFDLISAERTVALPSKKLEWFVREPGRDPVRTAVLPGGIIGYGFEGGENPPDPANFRFLLANLTPVPAEFLVPEYLIEPSISVSKQPLSRVGAAKP